MSSHHIVKEDQEPALIIANGQSCSYALIEQMLEWSPFVVVCDGAYDRIRTMEIKPDVVIGDFDSLGEYDVDPDVNYVKLVDQETTDLEKAIKFLEAKGFDYINVVWATGKRLDHTVNNLASLAKYRQIHLVIYDDHSKAFLLPQNFKKHYNKGDLISLIPLGIVEDIETTGLEFSLNKESLELGLRSGTSNKVSDTGIVQITHTKGNLVLLESRDETD